MNNCLITDALSDLLLSILSPIFAECRKKKGNKPVPIIENGIMPVAFLKAVSPAHAIISCGADNDYGHPHRETIELLDTSGIDYERTDLKGTIIVGSDGKNLKTAFADK